MRTTYHFPIALSLSRSILVILLTGVIGNQLLHGQPEPVGEDGIVAFMDSLFRVPQIAPETLEECSQFLQTRIEVGDHGKTECWEVERARATLVVGCMLGGHSNMLKAVMDASDECVPAYGGFDYCIGNIQFLSGNFEQAALYYQRALSKLDSVHYLVPNTELNLASALHECGKTEAAIERLLALAQPDAAWRRLEGFPAGQLDAQIRINAAAMMMSTRDYSSAIELLNGIDTTPLTPYWHDVKGYNLHLAYASSGFFTKADSIWSAHLQFLEPNQIPMDCFDQVMGSLLALGEWSYLTSIRKFIASQSNDERFTNLASFSGLLNPTLDSIRVQNNWELLQRANAVKRMEVENVQQQKENNPLSVTLNEMEETLKAASRRSALFQWLMAISILLVALVLASLYIKRRNKRIEIQHALAIAGKQDAVSIENDNQPKLKLLLEDTRTLNEALIRGKRIGEALMVVRKMEALYQFQTTQDASFDLNKLPGYDDLSGVEKEALRMTMMDMPTKEIAHQLRVSPGHVYNIRSAIRQKLEIPADTRLEAWLSSRLEDGLKP